MPLLEQMAAQLTLLSDKVVRMESDQQHANAMIRRLSQAAGAEP